MLGLIDKYTLGARVAPVAVVSFPLFLAVSAWIPFNYWPSKLAGGGVAMTMAAFVLGQLARDAGKAIESPIWASWGGPPTVRMLRHRDSTITSGSKARIHKRLTDLGVVTVMPSDVEEEQDSSAADKIYKTCSDWLRNKALELKAQSPFDVVHSENITYGFRRNLLGIRRYGFAILWLAIVAATIAFVSGRQPFLEACGLAVLTAFLGLGVTEAAMKRAADEYSVRLLNAVEAIPMPSRATQVTRKAKRTLNQPHHTKPGASDEHN